MSIKFSKKTEYKRVSRYKKKMRVRRKIDGDTERPRLSVFKSLSHVYAQVIDDTTGATLVAASTTEKALSGKRGKEGAKVVGKALAERAVAKNISGVVFDRNGFKYHGIIKELADAAREAGLRF